jgi:hypothetical protein
MSMDELSRIKALADSGQVTLAAREGVLGLMRGDAREMRRGYSAENAGLAILDFCHLAHADVIRAFTVDVSKPNELVPFLRYLAETGHSTDDVILCVEKPNRFWQEHADYLVSQEPNVLPSPTPLVTA